MLSGQGDQNQRKEKYNLTWAIIEYNLERILVSYVKSYLPGEIIGRKVYLSGLATPQ